MKTLLPVSVILLLVAGCATTPETPATIGEGTCKIPGLQTPPYAVRGQLPYDQRWINRATEGLVTGCNQPRPKARPADWDVKQAIPKPKLPAAMVAPVTSQQANPTKRRWFDRFRKQR